MKYIVYKTIIRLKTLQKYIFDNSIHIFDLESDLSQYKKDYAKFNSIPYSIIQLRYIPIPNELYNEIMNYIDSLELESKDRNEMFYVLFKYKESEKEK